LARRIAVLWHARQHPERLHEYAAGHMADVWLEDGHEVVHLFGTRRFVPADVLLVHVDLTVVPQRYLSFARRYPVALNTHVGDIRKGRYSELQLRHGEHYDGPVIVKTQRNHAGRPEKKLRPFDWLRNEATPWQRRRARQRIKAPLPYRIYDRVADVPQRFFVDPRWIVERFLPQYENGRYYINHLYVLGGRSTSLRMSLDDPVVTGQDVDVEIGEPHPRAFALLERMSVDYGKVDYVVHDGEAYLLDVNKTIGAFSTPRSPELEVARRQRAYGIYDYFDGDNPRRPLTPNTGTSSAPVLVQSAFEGDA
jgi:hypothetical protein